MRTHARLQALQRWTFERVCKGRRMKTEPPDRQITNWIELVEPKVFIAYAPKRYDESLEELVEQAKSTAPSITIMPVGGNVRYAEEKRFDRYNGVHRSQDFGQQLSVQMLFTVYEDGVRLPGFIDKYEETGEFDLSLVREGTQDGLQTLLDWMDDFNNGLLTQLIIPDSDLILDESNFVYGMRSDQKYIADTRPLYYGLVNVNFESVADSGEDPEIAAILD